MRTIVYTKVVVRTDDVMGFFSRAKSAARRADRGETFEGKVTLSFEDPQRMLTVIRKDQDRTRLRSLLLQGAESTQGGSVDEVYFENLRNRIRRRVGG